ncbi:MAG: hypothetical protein ACQEXX_01565 [Bacillota bacterium]
MKKTLVVSRREGNTFSKRAEWLEINEIWLVKAEGKKGNVSTLIYTEYEEFITRNAAEQIIFLLEQEEGFIRTDRGMMANFNKNVDFDEKFRTVYHKNGKTFITVTVGNYKKIINYLQDKHRECMNK